MESINLENINNFIKVFDIDLCKSLSKNEKDIYFHLIIYSYLFNNELQQNAHDNLIIRAKKLSETIKFINENKEQNNLKTSVFNEIKKLSNEKKTKKSESKIDNSSNIIKHIIDNYYNDSNENENNTSITNQIIHAVMFDRNSKSNSKNNEIKNKKNKNEKTTINISDKIIDSTEEKEEINNNITSDTENKEIIKKKSTRKRKENK
jgi:hypothetical protein